MAGWGVVVVLNNTRTDIDTGESFCELYGPVVTEDGPYYLGATYGSNNTGELTAISEALIWLLSTDMVGWHITILFDSLYAANVTQGIWTPHDNLDLASTSYSLFKKACQRFTFSFRKVKSHTGQKWNERADYLADLGGNNHCNYLVDLPLRAEILRDMHDLQYENLPESSSSKVPSQWLTSLFSFIPKDGDLKDPAKWRALAVKNVSCKIYCAIITQRLIIGLKNIETQNGSRKGRGTQDAIYTLLSTLTDRKEAGLDTWIVFIDYVKAYDTVHHEGLYCIMDKFGIPPELIAPLRGIYDNSTIKFMFDEVSRIIEINSGAHQGSVEGPILFQYIIAAMHMTTDPQHSPISLNYSLNEQLPLQHLTLNHVL